MSDNSKEKPPLSYTLLVIIFVFAVGLPDIWLALHIVQNYLGLQLGSNYFLFMGMLEIIVLLIMLFPASVLIEFIYSRWKKRKLRVVNVFIMSAMISEAIFCMFVFYSVFAFTFPELSLTNEQFSGLNGLLLGLMIALPMIIVGLTSRIPKLRKYVIKIFE